MRPPRHCGQDGDRVPTPPVPAPAHPGPPGPHLALKSAAKEPPVSRQAGWYCADLRWGGHGAGTTGGMCCHDLDPACLAAQKASHGGGAAQRWSQRDQPKGRVKLAQVSGVRGDDWLAGAAGADHDVGVGDRADLVRLAWLPGVGAATRPFRARQVVMATRRAGPASCQRCWLLPASRLGPYSSGAGLPGTCGCSPGSARPPFIACW